MAFGLGLAACSSGGKSAPNPPGNDAGVDESSAGNDGAAAGDQSSGTDGASDGESDGAVGCHAPGFAGGEQAQMIASVAATITDVSGAPISDLQVSVTGIDISFPGKTAADGTVTVSPNKNLKAPAFRYGDGLTYARLLAPLRNPSSTLPSLVTAKFPATGAPLAAGASATSGDLTLTIAAGASVLIDELDYDTADKQALRAVTLPIARLGDVTGGLAFDLVIAAAPADTFFCPPAAVSVPNTLGWPAGTKVEFLILGGDVSQTWARWGGWAKVSDGQVSDDGASIVTAPGGGLPVLDVIGIRKGS
jgi:hypothetical protein